MKYLKYYISILTLVVAIYVCTLGTNFPTIFFICFSMFIILGDILLSQDDIERTYKNTFLLNLPMYINLPLLLLFLFIVVFILGENSSNAFSSFLLTHLNIDIVYSRASINTLDSISSVAHEQVKLIFFSVNELMT